MTKSKIVYSLLILPAVIFLLAPALLGELGSKPLKRLLLNSGYCTLGFLTLSLALSPLNKHFSKVQVLKALNRHRRAIGITVFLYASFHLTCVLVKAIMKNGGLTIEYFLLPVVWTGTIAYLILFLMTLTSNDGSIRTLGYSKWKALHRFVYGVEGLIIIHIFLKNRILALSVFIPLIIIQCYRRKHHD